MMPDLLGEIFARYGQSSSAQLERVVLEIKKLQKDQADTKSQGYFDRLQRASSWLAKAKQMVADPEAKFIFLWIALNALCGVRPDVLKTGWWRNEERSRPPLNTQQGDDKVPRELEWFLWRICGLDVGGRILRNVIEGHWPDVETVLRSHYVMSYYWNWRWQTEKDIDKRKKSSIGKVKDAISLVSDGEKIYQALCEIVIWRLRTLRN